MGEAEEKEGEGDVGVFVGAGLLVVDDLALSLRRRHAEDYQVRKWTLSRAMARLARVTALSSHRMQQPRGQNPLLDVLLTRVLHANLPL